MEMHMVAGIELYRLRGGRVEARGLDAAALSKQQHDNTGYEQERRTRATQINEISNGIRSNVFEYAFRFRLYIHSIKPMYVTPMQETIFEYKAEYKHSTMQSRLYRQITSLQQRSRTDSFA